MMLTTVGSVTFLASIPERLVRSLAALLGGTLHETFVLTLPRLVRSSRLYEATARNLLRVTIELVGGVEAKDARLRRFRDLDDVREEKRGRRGKIGGFRQSRKETRNGAVSGTSHATPFLRG